jgi:hypothetical protein
MVGNLVAKVATQCRAEPADRYAATRMVRRSRLTVPGPPVTGPVSQGLAASSLGMNLASATAP